MRRTILAAGVGLSLVAGHVRVARAAPPANGQPQGTPADVPRGPGDAAERKADAAEKKADAAEQKQEANELKANEAAEQKSGNGANVNGESLTTPTQITAPAIRFGAQRQLTISSDAALTISDTTISGESGSTTTIQLEPAVDYFVVRNFSIGGFLLFDYTSAAAGHASTFGIGPRVGYNFSFSDLLSVWPRVGVSINNTSSTTSLSTNMPGVETSTTVSGTSVALNVFVPVMFHPAPHFFAGFGPFLDTDLSGDPRATSWGGRLTIGGWFQL